ncbi:bifunctional 5,10-methylenetetrahydrofolate dehydrogenase/5,10-methenyltetrahydrofolate cyclohydrolase [Suipraeoptans intestinalis]|uniref:bifunctional 5,10-methylenetetrahydrofolate dehydrogenase/5,10-methenyltetrahydrofolate cyclohydrolase n=1 Tax=Suipraeoptans intestinalis TaxID=2606628 RepID=UPI0023F21DD9|nr:tetrahydrofolate dehydrogenase/cyclohydrolase catalytic domain-containing protein [Suipraeoptans intestinalis]MDD7770028.1 tetrahydrofolate dehydrogenase/cyclohydrolase catalytic domain-containing protein [Suipraeoptans intestinalis]MDY3121058.1 tetrahydrofolate dehydrogenase/cyclohydrolase catalytic domain-containing protein [Suipraeoptans intestinalis]
MGIVMKGADVANAMKEELLQRVAGLKEKGVSPCLAILRVGARPDDLAYERGAKKRMELLGIDCRTVELPRDIRQETFEERLKELNEDGRVHGILLFRPLPGHLNEEAAKRIVDPGKDMDGMCPANVAKVFAGDDTGYAPCTAEAVIELLDHYKIPLSGKRVVVVGRSMVVGRPLSMLLLKRHATVTICHTRTRDLPGVCREAEILVAAAGKARMITQDMVGEQAVVADVGINVDEEGNMWGDVDFETVQEQASHISPVPRGVGSITTSVLAKHVVQAAERQTDNE